MKRYALFAFDRDCPYGGFDDFIDSSDSFDFLFQTFYSDEYSFGQIIDTTTLQEFRLERE